VKKIVVATLCALSVAAAGQASAFLSSGSSNTNAQINNLQMQLQRLQAQVNSMSGNKGGMMTGGLVNTYAPLSWQMMSNYSGVGREMNILNARKAGNIGNGVYLGGEFEGDVLWQHNNGNGDWSNPVLQANGSLTGQNASRLAISNARLSALANFNSWVSGYMQVGVYNPNSANAAAAVTVHGLSKTPVNAGTTGLTLQDAYLTFGNLSQQPFFGFLGYKDIDFGQFASVNQYANPLDRTVFQATGDTLGVGYTDYGFTGTFSLMNPGRQSAVVSSTSATQQQNLRTLHTSSILNNYAVNLGYGMTNGALTWHLGTGYLAGTSFFKAGTSTTTAGEVGAWDINTKLSAYNFDLLGEFVTTTQGIQDTTSAAAQGLYYSRHVTAWQVAGDYNFPMMGHKSVLSASYSNVELNHVASQVSLGMRTEAVKNVWTGIEYDYNHGNLISVGTNGTAGAPYVVAEERGGTAPVDNNTVLFDVTAMF